MSTRPQSARPDARPRRLLLIKPSAYDAQGQLLRGKRGFFPSRTLPYLAALSGSEWDVRIVDDAVQEIPVDADVSAAVFTGMLTNVPRAIDLARQFHQRGTTTIIGGPGVFSRASQLRDSGAFDCIFHGEAESHWATMLDDLAADQLAEEYQGRHVPLNNLPLPRYDLVDMHRYVRPPLSPTPLLSVETARGCPHNCRFCGVSLFFGRQMRFRPVADVVEEIRALGGKYFILVDDNLTADPARSAELFSAIKPLKIRWGGQFAMNIVDHPDVLRLAAESGCMNAMVGVESLLADNLRDAHKPQNVRHEIRHVVETFHAAGVPFTASLIFGLDHDTPESIAWTTREMIEAGVDLILPWVLTPGPGSLLFDELQRDGRILHENFSLYNGVDVVFRPARMSPSQLEQAYWDSMRTLYTLPRSVGRAIRSPRKAATAAFNLYFWNTIRRGRHPFTSAL
ncbi:MAG: B12-binding domain-containing radical SAM protein [Phycisphaerae bacterium]